MLPPRSVRRAYFVSKYCKICLKFYYQLIQVNVIIVSVCSVSQLTVSAEAGHEPRAGREGRGVGGGVRPTQPRVVRALAVQTCSDTTNFFNVITTTPRQSYYIPNEANIYTICFMARICELKHRLDNLQFKSKETNTRVKRHSERYHT